ncbi:MAG: hypothetical protein IJE43_06260 [Alphaproteobacteria bacterium]|nr:hypothetical protein [Alphaproteobacteria bacterium]
MRNSLNKICIIALGCLLIICASIKSSHAFGPYPPMPFDIVLDVPANAGKVVSILQETKRLADSVKRYQKSLNIQAVVGKVKLFATQELGLPSMEGFNLGGLGQNGALGAITGGITGGGASGSLGRGSSSGSKKTSGTGDILAKNSDLDIAEGETDEEKLIDAFYKLFAIYPVESDELKDNEGVRVKLPILMSAYQQKAKEYQQDMIMKTYLYAQKKELYLDLIEKTVDRLDACQKAMGADSGLEEPEGGCTFFGMQMVQVPSQEEAPSASGADDSGDGGEGETEEPAGQSEEMQNAYVVSMVYDRLLRIIEDMTAVEAEFKASQQLNIITPAEQGDDSQQSDASTYTNQMFKFAYTEQYEYNNAFVLTAKNTEGAKGPIKSIDGSLNRENKDDIPDLGKLQGLENILNKAIQIHNLKSQLPDYKMQYRQYLMAEKIHKRTFNSLRESEQCIIDFMKKYGEESAVSQWRGAENPFNTLTYIVNHDLRADNSISKALLKEYQDETDKKILGATDDEQCKDHYIAGHVCPSGYTLDTEKPCQEVDENGKTNIIKNAEGQELYPCVVKTITPEIPEDSVNGSNFADMGATAGQETTDNFAAAGISDPNDENSFNENEFMSNSDQSAQLENDTRKKNEMAWRIGANKMMELTEAGILKFDPWVDQKYLQKEYLRNKYRNLRLIVKSMDQAKISYMVAVNKTIPDAPQEDFADLITDMQKISTYMTLDESLVEAEKEHCATPIICPTSGIKLDENTGAISITGRYKYETYQEYDEEIEEYVEKTRKVPLSNKYIYSQIQGTQTYSKEQIDASSIIDVIKIIPNELKERYFKKELSSEEAGNDTELLAEYFYRKAALPDRGRIVARDFLEDVITVRKEVNKDFEQFLKAYYGPSGSITTLEKTIEGQKTSLDNFIIAQDEAQQAKNKALDEQKRTKERLLDIENQIEIQEKLIKKLEDELKVEQAKSKPNRVIVALKQKSMRAATMKIEQFKTEQEYLTSSEKACETDCPTSEYLPQKVIDNNILKAENELEMAKAKTNEIKISIAENQKKLEELKEKFSDEYLVKAEALQKEIEDSNTVYEDFVEPENEDTPYRMEKKGGSCKVKILGTCFKYENAEYEKDNLEKTINVFWNKGCGEDLKCNVKKYIEQEINNLIPDVKTAISALGLPEEFYLAGELTGITGYTLNSVNSTMDPIINTIKDKLIEYTVKEIVDEIKDADKDVNDEMEAAIDEIEEVATKLGVDEDAETNAEGEIDVYDATKYGYTVDDNGNRTPNEVTTMHKTLIDKLKASELEGILSEDIIAKIYGIPELNEDVEATHKQGSHPLVDDEYFAGLPARGVMDDDINSGRDYSAPKGPMMNLPPLREVFYYSPLDYDDVPKEGYKPKRPKKARFSPSISHLLGYKFDTYDTGEKWEYIPEIWRYILAVPSLREDGRFQQTFIERSMKADKLNKHVTKETNNVEKINNEYAHIIARAGVYPCRLGSKIIDVQATMDFNNKGDKLKEYNIKYIYTPAPENSSYPVCKEVTAYGNTITHQLADEGKNTAKMEKNGLAITSYNEHSELGQFIDKNKQYRWFLQSVYTFLTDTTKKTKKETPPNQINNVWRQLHDLSAYKRNLFGNFLDTVSAEKDAKTNLENSEYQLKEVLAQLCEQVHDLGVTIGDTEKAISELQDKCNQCVEKCQEDPENNVECMEGCEEICSEEAMEKQKTDICVNYAFQKGLAKNVDDKAYGKGEYDGYNGVAKEGNLLYNEIYFLLDEEKDKLLEDVQEFPSEDPNHPEETLKLTYNKVMEDFKKKYWTKDNNGGKWDSRIADRMEVIEAMHTALTQDSNEIVYLTPDENNVTNNEGLGKARANKRQSFDSGEEGLKGMDNQSKIVPYCPSY